MESPLSWEVPLDSPPEVVNVGRNAHGYVPADRYRLRDLWSLHLYGYHAMLRLNGQEVEIRPGSIGITPPGTLMEYRYEGTSVHVYAHFKLSPGPTRSVAAIQDLGALHDDVYARFYACVGMFARERRRVEARLWDVLWDVASLSAKAESSSGASHQAVRIACDAIDRRLAEPLAVAEIAALARVSTSYLARLFKEELGDSVVGYIRNRRLDRASYLLQRSSLPIKEVAVSVGIPDLQHFNKAIRTRFGVSPREWRARG